MKYSEIEIKKGILNKLIDEHCFWSYNTGSVTLNNVSDDILIEKTLQYLDLDDIALLFEIFPYKKIKAVWLERLVPQEDYLYMLNRFLAWYYFGAKRPDAYIKSMATRYLNKIA